MATNPTKKEATKPEPEQQVERTPLLLITKPGKKVEVAYFLFEGSEDVKENRLPRIVATKTANRILRYANAEEILKDELQSGFVKAAWDGGWTLVETIKQAAEQNAQMKLIPKWKKGKTAKTGLQERAKARLVAMFNPATPAAEMVEALIQQLTETKEALTATLVKYEAELGRREDGTLKFRTREPKKTDEADL